MPSLLAAAATAARSAPTALAAAAKIAICLTPPVGDRPQLNGAHIAPDATARVQVQCSNGEWMTVHELSPGKPRCLLEGPCVYRVARAAGVACGVDLQDATPLAASANTLAPALSSASTYPGTAATTNGTWTTQGAVSYAYQWRKAGVDIPGATGSTYALARGDVDAAITCAVTMTDANGSITTVSNAVTPVMVAVNQILPAVTPGAGTTGTVLTASQGTWDASSSTVYTRQWRKAGVDIAGQTAGTYTVLVGDLGSVITCRVTATTTAGAQSAISNGVTPA